jgi:hypothetical protein
MKLIKNTLAIAAFFMGANQLAAQSPLNYMDQSHKAKLGVYTPAEEARIRAEQASSAYRAAPLDPIPIVSWVDQHLKGKQGSYTPVEEARLQAERDSTAFRSVLPPPAAPYVDIHLRMKQGVAR